MPVANKHCIVYLKFVESTSYVKCSDHTQTKIMMMVINKGTRKNLCKVINMSIVLVVKLHGDDRYRNR